VKKIKMKVTAVLDARPEAVYTTLADYRGEHPHILPKKHLYDLQVEQGGYGAGTIIRFKSRFLGVEQSFYQRVSEPEPGRVLVEQDIDSALQESVIFTVIPLEHERKSHVEIFVAMNASPGLKGLLECVVISMMFPPVLREELKLLEAVARKRRSVLTETG